MSNILNKVKEIVMKILNTLKEANKRRKERAAAHELKQYYDREYRNDYISHHPYFSIKSIRNHIN